MLIILVTSPRLAPWATLCVFMPRLAIRLIDLSGFEEK